MMERRLINLVLIGVVLIGVLSLVGTLFHSGMAMGGHWGMGPGYGWTAPRTMDEVPYGHRPFGLFPLFGLLCLAVPLLGFFLLIPLMRGLFFGRRPCREGYNARYQQRAQDVRAAFDEWHHQAHPELRAAFREWHRQAHQDMSATFDEWHRQEHDQPPAQHQQPPQEPPVDVQL